MSHTKNSPVAGILKTLVVTFFKLLAIVIAFTCKIAGLILTKISELFEKLAGHGTGH
jgi:hypothetical protein